MAVTGRGWRMPPCRRLRRQGGTHDKKGPVSEGLSYHAFPIHPMSGRAHYRAFQPPPATLSQYSMDVQPAFGVPKQSSGWNNVSSSGPTYTPS